MLPHQLRVIDEKRALDVKLGNLKDFRDSPLFARLDIAEQDRLKRQLAYMELYSEVLGERITAFPVPVPEASATYEEKPVSEMAIGAKVVNLNPGLAGQAITKEAVVAGDTPIADINTFAMVIDNWHAEKIEQGNRMLNIPEGSSIDYENADAPGLVQKLVLEGAYMKAYRIGVMTSLELFANLPFGASIEEAQTDEPG